MEGSGRPGPVSMLALATAAGLSIAILYNALFAQVNGHRQAGAPGGTTRLDVQASVGGNTIQLKYDPVAEDVQRELQAVGFYKGGVDGVTGRRTRDAIAAYQKANGLTVTGEPSHELIEHIRYTRQVAEASLFTGSVDPAPDAELRASVRRVQATLSELAYYQGEISGEMQRQTEVAIRQFEREHGLEETGQINAALQTALAKISGQQDAQ